MSLKRFSCVWFCVLLTLGSFATTAHAASVGPSGYTNSFNIQPSAADWSTFSIAGGAGDITASGPMDTAVGAVPASSITTQTLSDPTDPMPAFNGSATWSLLNFFLQTRPTGNQITLLMCTLVNNIGGNAASVTLSYDFTKAAAAVEEVDGQRAYYSLTGAAGSWLPIPEFSANLVGRLTATLNITWPAGGTLYVLWADDNGSGSPDTAMEIDNFSATALSAVQVPVAITSDPQSQTVGELQSASFTVGVSGNPPPTFQWYKNNGPLNGATNATYVTGPAALSDNNAQFKVVVANTASNVNYAATSAVAVLTVNADTNKPVLVSASGVPPSTVNVQFSEPLRADTATNIGNYAITSSVGNLVINSAVLLSDGTNLTLTTSPQTLGTTYTLIVNGVRDRSAASNQIAANSLALFTSVSFTPIDIGPTLPAGTYTPAGNGFDITGGGLDIGGTIDQFSFDYQSLAGDFDVKVRLAGLTLTDVWSKAGLMARETLATNSPFSAALAMPGAGGAFFESRASTSAAANTTGYFPANYPNTWLRLKRSNTLFTGYASVDGANWTQLGSLTASLANTLFVGLVVSSHTNNVGATAQFRDYGPVVNGTISTAPLPIEPPGPSSRKTPFVITEIMFKPVPATNESGASLEFIEIYNSNPFIEEISNFRIRGDIDYDFPPNTFLQGNQYVIIAANPAALEARYSITGVRGPWSANTNVTACVTNVEGGVTNVTGCVTNVVPEHLNSASNLKLINNSRGVVLEVSYSNDPPWPVAADGTGHSLVLARPSYGEADPHAWAASDQLGGSPGRADAYTATPQRNVVINEFLANSEEPEVDYIELYNHSTVAVDISGCTLSDEPTTNKFVIPATTLIPSNGFVVFYQTNINFGLSAAGETIYFRAPNGIVLDAVKFKDQSQGVPSGRSPDGATEFYPLSAKTPGAANAKLLVRDVVINEIMYKPVSGSGDDEYVELYNKGTNLVSLSKWKFNDGIDYTFPTNAVIGADSYVVVAKSITNLLAHYPNLNSNNTYGNFGGKLKAGDHLVLTMPELNITTSTNGLQTNHLNVAVDEVTFGPGGNWGHWANGGGSSLELIDPRSDHRLAHNWADSDETLKAPWTTVEATGLMDNGSVAPTTFEVLSLDDGEWLLDNAELISGGVNILSAGNSTFESGVGNWVFRGTHIRSTLETNLPAFAGSACMHIRSTARGDTMGNRCVCTVLNGTPTGTITLRAKVRWLRGWPEILLRIKGNSMEAFGRLSVPVNLGTPGERNSRALTNAAPALWQVQHTPVVPAANQAVVVTARVHDPDGLASVTLKYRLDSGQTIVSSNMVDNGTGPDAVAGDGIFSGTIPGQGQGVMVAFQVVAVDTLGASQVFPLQDSSYKNPFECMVLFGDTVLSTAFGTYRQWMTAANVSDWQNRPALSNEQLYETFVYGNFRAIYGARAKYNGSPYHQFSGSPPSVNAHYTIDLPLDNIFLGTESLHKIHAPGNGPFGDQTLQREQTCYWMARQMNLPWGYRRFVNMFFNGNRRTSGGQATDMMEDAQTPGADMIAEFFPDDQDGNLYKLQPWFEQDDSTGNTGVANQSWCTQVKFTTPSNGVPVFKTARYRWNWLTRAANGSANEYQPAFNLVDAANLTSSASLVANYSAIADYEEVFRIFAVEHASGNWDAVGSQNQQNMYGYMPEHGKWHLMVWDWNIVLGSANSDTASWTPGQNLGNFNPATPGPTDTAILNLYTNAPLFRRAFLRGLKELANGPMLPANVEMPMDAKYRAFLASGVTPRSPFGDSKTFISQQRTAIFSLLNTEEAPTFIVNGGTGYSTNNNYLLLSGKAPVDAKELMINGVLYPVTWTTVKDWSIQLALGTGTNQITIQGVDLNGRLLSNVTATISINYTGAPANPKGALVINEIMYHPTVTNASYVEIYNNSTAAFDISKWRLDGLDYTFPNGTVMGGRSFVTLAKNIAAANSAAYNGNNAAVFLGEFPGQLDPHGQTLTLVKPGSTLAEDLIVSKVRYEPIAPWPAGADGQGYSLQLIDPTQDASRVGNWSDGTGWKFFTMTANTGPTISPTNPPFASASNFLVYVQLAGEAYVDDISLVPLSGPYTGTNVIQNGGFESPAPLSDTWFVPASMANSSVTNTYAHSGNYSLHVVNTTAGSLINNIRQSMPSLATNVLCTLSFWYHTTSSTNITVRTVGGTALNANVKQTPIGATPTTTNSTLVPLDLIPPLWLNEVQANNVSGPTDSSSQHDPWIELYNSGTNDLSLDNYYLANNYTNLAQWAFPNGSVIHPGQFLLVWADGQPEQTTANEWHTSFRLNNSTGSVALARLSGALFQVMDYLNYSGLGPNQSYGDFPDGQPFDRQIFFTTATPGTNNYGPPVNVLINEWVASNQAGPGGYADPADGKYDDWFELYNAAAQPADIGGFYLTDTRANKLQWRIPNGTTIPGHGYLLVWADNDLNENGTGTNGDLHANFNLNKGGEAIGLYAVIGTNTIEVDYVEFLGQTTDVSQGRFPDGATNIITLSSITPRAANVSSGNRAPVLTAIPNAALILGQTLSFTATATDPDGGQTLAYSLLPGAPAGATIDSASGLFHWTPNAGQAPSSPPITVQVADNGVPSLTDSKTFTVVVALPPIATITQAGASVSLSFPTLSGKQYQIQYKNDLNSPTWTPLPLPPSGDLTFTATGSSKTVNDSIGTQRFYRIVALN